MTEVVPEFYYGSLCLTDYPYMVGRDDDGVGIGSAEKIMEVIETLLANGDVMLSPGSGNRTLTVPVYVMGSTLKEVAENEAALQLECDKDYNELTLIPGGLGAATIFDTYAADAVNPRDDKFEAELIRRVDLAIPAAPFPRSAKSLTTSATPTTPSPVTSVISNGTSATGWAGGSVTVDAGALRISSGAAPTTSPLTVSTTRTSVSVDLSTMPYVYMDVKGSTYFSKPTLKANGASLPLVATGVSPLGSPWARYYFQGSGTATSFEVTGSFTIAPYGFNRQMWLDNLTATNISPRVTGFQRSFILPVGGASPTEGSIHVSHPTDDLGVVMVYTCEPDNAEYSPNLRQYLAPATQAAATTDTSLVSGSRNVLSTPWVVSIPASSLSEGSYAIWARLRSSSTGVKTITWATQTRFNTDNIIAGSLASGSVAAPFNATATWGSYAIGRVMLPGLLPQNSGAMVDLTLTGPASVDIDEAWIFNSTTGALTVVGATKLLGTTPPKTLNLWIDTASVAIPRPTVWRGTASDRSDSYGAGSYVAARGRHQLTPTEQYVFVSATGAEYVTVDSEHYPRWPNYAAD